MLFCVSLCGSDILLVFFHGCHCAQEKLEVIYGQVARKMEDYRWLACLGGVNPKPRQPMLVVMLCLTDWPGHNSLMKMTSEGPTD